MTLHDESNEVAIREGLAGVTRRWVPVSQLLALTLLWLLSSLVLWDMDRSAIAVASDAYASLATLAMNSMAGFAFVVLVAGISRRFLFSTLLVVLFQYLIYQASATKLSVLGTPLTLQDFYFLTSFNRANVELLGSYVEHPALVVTGLGVVLLVLGLVYYFERPWCGKFTKRRWGLLGLGIGLVATLYLALWPWTMLYTRERVRPSSLSVAPTVLHSGLMSSLVYKHLERANTVYTIDVPALRNALDEVGVIPRTAATPASPPDIVVVLSESFMDPRALNGMKSLPDPIPNVRSWIDRGQGGRMIVPTYGGGTIRTEFEVLTGMPMTAFPTIMYPYVDMTLIRVPGLVSVLRDRGYDAIAVHGNSGAFWNRSNVYRGMGVQRFLTRSQFGPEQYVDGSWYSDASMTDMVLQEMERHESPTFALAISMEAHGPYDKKIQVRDMDAWNAIELPEGLDGEAALSMRNYLYHLGNADREFARLLDGLRKRGRPFVLAFFGDHLPALAEVYDVLGFIDGKPPDTQTVPWVIISSEDHGGRQHIQAAISAWQLPAEVLNTAAIRGDAYFELMARLGQRLEVTQDQAELSKLKSGMEAAAQAQLNGGFEEYLK